MIALVKIKTGMWGRVWPELAATANNSGLRLKTRLTGEVEVWEKDAKPE